MGVSTTLESCYETAMLPSRASVHQNRRRPLHPSSRAQSLKFRHRCQRRSKLFLLSPAYPPHRKSPLTHFGPAFSAHRLFRDSSCRNSLARVTRYVARFNAEGNHEQASRTVSSASGMFLPGGFAALIVPAAFALSAVPHFDILCAGFALCSIRRSYRGANVAISLLSGAPAKFWWAAALRHHNSVGVVSTRCEFATILALRAGRGLITLALIEFGVTLLN